MNARRTLNAHPFYGAVRRCTTTLAGANCSNLIITVMNVQAEALNNNSNITVRKEVFRWDRVKREQSRARVP